MGIYKAGIFEYIDPLPEIYRFKLPSFLHLSNATNETVLLRLLLGHLHIKTHRNISYKSRKNYFFLPYKTASALRYNSICNSINKLFSDDANIFLLDNNGEQLERYLNNNRKNHYVYQQVLFEMTSFLVCQKQSSIAAFAHLYRCLEYLSYCFPLIYAAASKSYRGSFDNLKKFMLGDAMGELKFFRQFLKTLFADEKVMLNYMFEINVLLKGSLDKLKKDLEKIYKFDYSFEGKVLEIKFEDMLSLLGAVLD